MNSDYIFPDIIPEEEKPLEPPLNWMKITKRKIRDGNYKIFVKVRNSETLPM